MHRAAATMTTQVRHLLLPHLSLLKTFVKVCFGRSSCERASCGEHGVRWRYGADGFQHGEQRLALADYDGPRIATASHSG